MAFSISEEAKGSIIAELDTQLDRIIPLNSADTQIGTSVETLSNVTGVSPVRLENATGWTAQFTIPASNTVTGVKLYNNINEDYFVILDLESSVEFTEEGVLLLTGYEITINEV